MPHSTQERSLHVEEREPRLVRRVGRFARKPRAGAVARLAAHHVRVSHREPEPADGAAAEPVVELEHEEGAVVEASRGAASTRRRRRLAAHAPGDSVAGDGPSRARSSFLF